MKANRSFSLNTYIIATVVVVHLLLAPILFTLIVNLYKDSSTESFITNAKNIAGLLSEDLSDKHYITDRNLIIGQLDSAILSGNILFIDIIDDKNEVLSPYDALLISSNNFIEDSELEQHQDGVYFLSVPIFLDSPDDRSFRLRLGYDESTVTEQIDTIQTSIIFLMLLYVLSMVLLFSLITKFINKPLLLLRKQSTIIAQGNIETPLQVPSYITDIKDLSEDLEKMRVTLIDMANNMQIQATHDELTGLPNRYLYTDRMHQAVSLSQRRDTPFAALLLDLDRFKEINDTLGHGIGDKVLKIISKRMLDGMRDSDTIARVGGDEFSIILINVNLDTARIIAHKIIQLIEPIIDVDHHTLKVSASIGIALYPEHGDTPELLLQHADVAMYYAKHNNKNVAAYFPAMDSDNYENLMLVNDMKSSMDEEHFEILFQPKIDLATGLTCGCELLLRWHHPYLGMILPDKFIPLAEQENTIAELTCWAASQSFKRFKKIISGIPDFQIAVNVSPMNLHDTKLLSSLLTIINENEFSTKNLVIEITENVIMKNPERSVEVLNHFNDAGIQISIDDFGTGYSSLSYLHRFPITELKVDKTFITNLTRESTNYPIVKASIAMAHDLGITVVAEGIETKSVHELLAGLSCDRVQGYYYAKPMMFEEFETWLESARLYD